MTTFRVQSFRFAVVGLVSNAVLYILYVFLTWVGSSPSAAVSVVFAVGALQTFVFNKSWTFSKRGNSHHLAKYLTVYIGAYFLNILALYVLVDRFEYPHRLVQAGAVLIIGALLFLGQRYWVFKSSGPDKLSEMQ